MVRELPVVEASGSHREVGRQIGEECRELVAGGLDAYRERFAALAGFGFADAVDRSRAYLRPAVEYLPGSVDQLRGLAEGANQPFELLFALNCSEEFTCAADREWPPDGADRQDAARPGTSAAGHCTSLVVAAGGRVVSGHNEDWYPEEIERLVVRRVRLTERSVPGGVRSEAGITYISAGPPYNLPFTGLTAAGFSASANTVYYRDERVGVPDNCILTAVLEQPDLESARDLILGAPRARGANHLLSDRRGRVWDLETTGALAAVIEVQGVRRGDDADRRALPDDALLFAHTNHYVAPELMPGDASRSEGSRLRRDRAERLLLAGLKEGADLVELAAAVLSDHENAPSSICAHWDDGDPDPAQSVTTASMVWDLAEGRARVAGGQPCGAGYAAYDL